MLGTLTVTSYVGYTDTDKLCWVHWHWQAMLGALTVASYVGCTDSHSLCWVHWQSQATLGTLTEQQAMARALTVRLDSEGICCSVRKQTPLYQIAPTQRRISKTTTQLYTFLHHDHFPATQSDSHGGNSAAGWLNKRKETGMLDWGRWHDHSGWGVKLNGTTPAAILPQAAE